MFHPHTVPLWYQERLLCPEFIGVETRIILTNNDPIAQCSYLVYDALDSAWIACQVRTGFPVAEVGSAAAEYMAAGLDVARGLFGPF